MRNFKGQRLAGNIMQSKPVLIFLCLLFFISLWSLIGFWEKMLETQKNRKISEQKLSELTEAKTKLEADVNKLGTDRGIEEVLREDFGLAKEGEGMIIVVENQNEENSKEKEGKGFFSFLKNLFK